MKSLSATLVALILIAGCTPSTETVIKGDREVVQVTAGTLKDGSGNNRVFYILRDPHTGTDYLAVVDAGIVRMDPKPPTPAPKAEPVERP